MASNSAPRKRRITRQYSTLCICCEETIESDDKYAQVYPCGHDYCTNCLLNEHAMRGASPLVCKCNGQVISHKIVEQGLFNDDTVEYPTEAAPSTTTVDDETIENYRPFTLLLKKKLNDLRSAEEGQISIIYFATSYSQQYRKKLADGAQDISVGINILC